ncbi:MAG: transposase [Acidobacteriia bacterium]|nr:transposase [Terriglobia bacterium]
MFRVIKCVVKSEDTETWIQQGTAIASLIPRKLASYSRQDILAFALPIVVPGRCPTSPPQRLTG